MIKKYHVVDSNYLNTPQLKDYLSKSVNNYAVLIDYMSMEMYKAGNFIGVKESLETLKIFPNQVVILKSSQVISSYVGKAKALKNLFIDKEQTNEFKFYCENLYKLSQIKEHINEAFCHINALQKDANDLISAFKIELQHFTSSEIKNIRSEDQPYSIKVWNKIRDRSSGLFIELYNNHPRAWKKPKPQEIKDLFIYRMALTDYLLFLRWVKSGAPNSMKPEKIRNDMIDSLFIVYATYYDGFFSDDVVAKERYNELNSILEII